MKLIAPTISGKLELPWEPLKIAPLGDIQYAGKDGFTALRTLREHIKWCVSEGAWYIGTGDYIDFLSPSNRERLQQAALYDTATKVIEDTVKRLEEELLSILEPTRGRWVAMVEGHHTFLHPNNETTGQRLASALGATYGGDCVMMRLTFRDSAGHGVVTKLIIHHGASGGVTPGGQINACRRFLDSMMVQFLFVGHYHQSYLYPYNAPDMTDRGEPHLFHQEKGIIFCGSFMEGWKQDSMIGGRPAGSYVEKRGLPAVTLGAPLVTLMPIRQWPSNLEIKRVGIGAQVGGAWPHIASARSPKGKP